MLKPVFSFVAIAFVGLLLQTMVVSNPQFVVPDISLVLVVILALYYRSVYGMLAAFALGLTADFASARFLGPNAAGSVVAYALAVSISNRVYADRSLGISILAGICDVSKSLTLVAMKYTFVGPTEIAASTGMRVLIEGLLTGAVAPFVLKLLVSGGKPVLSGKA